MTIAGSIVALVTPWRENGTLDVAALEQLITWHHASGTQALVVGGSTGEGLLLTKQERQTLIQTAVKHSQIPVIVGCGAPSTHETISLGEEALALGAHALLVVAPYYVRPTQLGLIKHFEAVCTAWKSPVVAYNNPARCAVDMSVEAIKDIAANPYIVALKDSSTDLSRIQHIRANLPRPIALLAGEDSCAADYLQQGGDGWVSVIGNVAPSLCRQVCDTKGQNVSQNLGELIEALGVAGNPVAIKEALSYAGRIRHDVRLPLMPMAEPNTRLQQAVRAVCA
jgi:4-hydroxy-tetrahydrodipicolinate synthase